MVQIKTSNEPLAQTFAVGENSGVFITKLGLFFSAVSSSLPVSIEIRTAFLGAPTREILPGSSVTKTFSEMSGQASATAATETVFQFDEPLYLHGGKTYAFVIKTNATNEYKVWTSRIGDYELGTTQRRVIRQIEPGVMFKSQGGLSYGAEAESDIKFKLYRAKFTTNTGIATLHDNVPPRRLLGTNPFYAKAVDKNLYVTHPNHGFQVGDRVHFQGVSGTVNGITAVELNTTHAITHIDGTGYRITLSSSANQTAAVAYGGTGIQATQQYKMDIAQLQLQTFTPDITNITYSGKFTTSKSFAGTETAGTLSTVGTLINGKDHYFDNPHVVLSDSNEAPGTNSPYPAIQQSTKITAVLRGINDEVSPVIDTQRAQLLTINNLIDNPHISATTGFNVPLTFVADSDAVEGSALAAHITRPVKLVNGATGIKVLFGGHREVGADFDLYFRTTRTGTDSDITEHPFTLQTVDNEIPNDTNKEMFHEYQYTIGGDFAKDLPEFDQYQLKLIMRSTNSSNVPRIKDLRTIAVA